MNIFGRIATNEAILAQVLGCPAPNIELRLVFMASLTGGKGFQTPPKTPRVDLNGKTRAERKAALRALTRPKYDAPQPREFWHSNRSERA